MTLKYCFRDLSPWYGDDKVNYCNRIQGTDGLTTFSNPQKDDVINFFVSDLCKTVWMVYGGSDTYKGPTGESKYHIPVRDQIIEIKKKLILMKKFCFEMTEKNILKKCANP